MLHWEVIEYLECGNHLTEVDNENQAVNAMHTSSSALCSQNANTPPQSDLSILDRGAQSSCFHILTH